MPPGFPIAAPASLTMSKISQFDGAQSLLQARPAARSHGTHDTPRGVAKRPHVPVRSPISQRTQLTDLGLGECPCHLAHANLAARFLAVVPWLDASNPPSGI